MANINKIAVLGSGVMGSAVKRTPRASSSALATADFCASQIPGGSAFVIGESGMTNALHEVGFILTENAPDEYVVKRGDTLWDISKLYLKSPWRWPELWGMNLDQVRNPHLIFPGQVLVLEKVGDRARLRVAQSGAGAPDNTVRLSPRVRSSLLDNGAIAAIPLNLIGPFLNEAVVFNNDELDKAFPSLTGVAHPRSG